VSVATTADVAAKLNPGVLKVSPKFTAILAFLLGQVGWTDPAITEMCVTSDGLLMAATTRDPFFNSIEGYASDLARNMKGIADHADLTPEEKAVFFTTTKRIQDWRLV
jgi:hypothetical protein